MTEHANIPVPVDQYAHWRINLRPTEYLRERLGSLSQCFSAIEKAQVRLRGWPYPYISRDDKKRETRSNYVGSWASSIHLEYWRFYQSAQFIHLFACPEVIDDQTKGKFKHVTRSHLSHVSGVDWDAIPGFIDVTNTLFTFTEIFEFVARPASTSVMGRGVEVSISVSGIKQFVLTVGWDRWWDEYFQCKDDLLEMKATYDANELISNSANLSLQAATWFFERFGWLRQPLDSFRDDQRKFLTTTG